MFKTIDSTVKKKENIGTWCGLYTCFHSFCSCYCLLVFFHECNKHLISNLEAHCLLRGSLPAAHFKNIYKINYMTHNSKFVINVTS